MQLSNFKLIQCTINPEMCTNVKLYPTDERTDKVSSNGKGKIAIGPSVHQYINVVEILSAGFKCQYH